MYLALYRKYRPAAFDDVISQEHITTTLKNQIATDQIAHAYLFTGTRGTGKTSCAKIMAKAVNCLSPVDGSPCGQCDPCKAIANGSTDIIEIDAASNNGVDSIRQIRDEIIYAPIDCRYKVYIIDEVHMLSPAAFNALLKTLEEPPAHAVFILATTEYYKVPATILSRCQQFLFSKIDPEQSAKRLLEIAEKEKVTLAPAAASLIARLSDGAMRDALSLLDQCLSADNNVTEELVRRCSGAADSGWLFGITEAAINKNPAEALKILDTLVIQGKDLSRFVEELTLHLRNLMLTKAVPNSGLVAAGEEELQSYEKQCKRCSDHEIMRWVELVSESLDKINRMKQTGQARLLSESLLIRLCSPQSDNDAASLSARLGALEHKIENLQFSDIKPQTEKGTLNAAGSQRPEPELMVLEPKPTASELKSAVPKPKPTASDPKSAVSEPKPAAIETLPQEMIPPPEFVEDALAYTPPAEYEQITEAFDIPNAEPWEQGLPFDPPYTELHEHTEEQSEKAAAPKPEPSIRDILQPIETEEQETEADGLVPPPEPIEGQTFFAEPAAIPLSASALLREPETATLQEESEAALLQEKSVVTPPQEKSEAVPLQAEPESAPPQESPEAAPSQEESEAEAPDPIHETDEELPSLAQPLPQWSEIVSLLPKATSSLLSSTQAFLYDGRIFIQAPPSARGLLLKNGRRAKLLRDSAKSVMGGRFELLLLKEQTEEEEQKEDFVTPFLARAKEMGIDVTINER